MRQSCVITVLLVGVIGCAGKKHLSADQYFREANENFRTGAYGLAIEQYHDLLDQYPFSQYNEEAELRVAHAQYLAGNYAEAIVSLTDFQRRHPTSPNLPFVGYHLGLCYVQQMRTTDRDQTAAQNAQSYFNTVVNQYPDSPFAELAREQLTRCRENLAEHELQIAKFYDKRGNRKAAEIRLLIMASRFSETDTAAEGLLWLAKLYRSDQQPQRAVLAYQAVAQSHPRSQQAKAARRALERLSPAASQNATDPIDQLLAANGRQRPTGTFETVQVPGLEPVRTAQRPTGLAAPGLAPRMDPFGRTRSY